MRTRATGGEGLRAAGARTASSHEGWRAAWVRTAELLQVRLGGRKRWLVRPLRIDLKSYLTCRRCPVCEIPAQGLRVARNVLDRHCRSLIAPHSSRCERSSTMPLQILHIGRELVGKGLRREAHSAADTGAHHRCPDQQGEEDRPKPRTRTQGTARQCERYPEHWRGAGRAKGGCGHSLRLYALAGSYFPEFESRKNPFLRSCYGSTFRYSNTVNLSVMKLSSHSAFLVLARVGKNLQSLQESIREWTPQPAPVLVPIPIQTERRTRERVGRHR